ncbi:contactin-3-like isoform X1 [Branchiostoma floridae x Branchiostoma belcheri]
MGFHFRLLWLFLSPVSVTVAVYRDSADVPRLGPPIVDAHQREIIAYRPDFASLQCAVRGRSSTTAYEWRKDGHGLILTPAKYRLVDGELQIFSLKRPEDEGKYQCVAYNEDDAEISLPTYLRIAYMEPFEPTARLPIVVNEGDTFRIRCDAPDHYPLGAFSWYKGVHRQRVEPDERIFISNKNGDLFFRYATLQDSGNYSCAVSPHMYYPTAHSPATSVILRSGNVTSRPPHVVLSPEVVHAVEGQTVTMQCFDDAYPVSETVWKRRARREASDDLPLPENAVLQSHDHLLILPDVRWESDGYYSCEVENTLGRMSILGRLTVNVPAKVTSPGTETPLRLGENITFKVTFEGTPPMTVTWYRNANEVVTSGKYVIKGDTLTVTDLRFTDRGRYQCMVQNEYGADQVFFSLVAVEPAIVKPLQDPQTAILGENATVSVRWEASPPLTISWRHGDTTVASVNMDDTQTVTIINPRMNVTKEGWLFINDITPDDEGEYTVTVSNQFGQAQASNHLTVIALPTEKVGTNNIPLVIGVNVAIAVVIIVGVAVAVWIIRKRRRDRVRSPARPDAVILRPSANRDEAFRVRLYIDDKVPVNEDFGTEDTQALTADL